MLLLGLNLNYILSTNKDIVIFQFLLQDMKANYGWLIVEDD